MSKEGRTRVNITLSDDLKEWFQGQAEKFGVPMSGLMAIALAQYKNQSDGINSMKDLNSIY